MFFGCTRSKYEDFYTKEFTVLNKQLRETMVLKNGSRVSVVGGGPAGSFFAIHLLREAKKARRNITVTIIDKKIAQKPDKMLWELKGCNYCAGIISPRLHKELIKNGIKIPRELICEEFTHIWIHGLWKNFPLKIPEEEKMYSLFRGTLPLDRKDTTEGFDSFLLKKAEIEGAAIIAGEVQDIRYTRSKKPCLTVMTPSGKISTIESDFVSVSTGINPWLNSVIEENRFFRSYQRINPLFTPPRVRPALIFELKPGRGYLRKYMNKEVYFIVSGSKKLRLDHISLVPKGEYLTVTLVGERIDRASFPEETRQIINEFLSLSHIQTILPHITLHNTPVACTCSPYMVAGPSKEPVGDRIAVVGDALGARFYRDGLFSAFVSAQALAKTVIHKGVNKKSLSDGYDRVVKWLEKDNRYGRLVNSLIQTALKSRILSRILYQTFATEMKFKKRDKWALGNVLWNIGSGAADYDRIFQQLISVRVLLSVLRGAFKTFRNILTELFFGLKWEEYGRYPTVILKEKRDYYKKSIAAPLGITLDASPEMERMYAIKIRASSRMIFEELGKFGDAEAKFLNLRFFDVRRISGSPNQVGSVVRYRLKKLPVSMDIRLVKCIPGKTLLYEPEELFSRHGKLLFDIAPTKDGNNRLVIYTAFDFKSGKTILGRIFWKFFKHIFPDYAHDVVWNHAICCIKKETEKRAA